MKSTFSNRTKRRKIQKELNALGDWKNDCLPNNSCDNAPEYVSLVQEINSNNSTPISSALYNNNNSSLDNLFNFASCRLEQSDHSTLENNIISMPNPTIESSNVSSDGAFSEIFNRQEDTLQSLAQWSVEYNVPQNAINKLLEILKFKAELKFLPKDCRTLLHSSSTKVLNLRKIEPDGIYYHFGLRNGILRFSSILPLNECIQIAIGIDGLPISKSSLNQFWPILAYIMPYKKYVFPVGVFYGNKKPNDSNDYLSDFISEVLDLTTSGIWIDNEFKKVEIKVVCCDSPAKAFILRVKSHSGYFSCTRCIHEGVYINSVCFPYNENGNEKRNHQDYVSMSNEHYHVSSTISCLVLIPNVDMIKLFPLDYMHLVCLGVTKRLITLWLYKGPSNVRLPSWKTKLITANLIKIKICITNDFARKPRGIEEIGRFKATELRQFLLYTGPVVLKNVLSKSCYQHFMVLSIAMTILLSSDYSEYLEYARQLLKYFVQTFQQIYGVAFMSHNIHGLLHLADDYENYGPLDNCSCFPFENYMKFIKKSLRKNEKPLQQLIRRYEERCQNENIKYNHNYQLNFTNRKPDCYILTKGGEIVEITDILSNLNTVAGKQFLNKNNFYVNPLKSSKLNIFIVKNRSDTIKHWDINKIKNKILMLNLENDLIAIPIIR